MACKLYIQIRIRDTAVKEQIQQLLLYVYEGLADIQEENILEDLETEVLEYVIVRKFLVDLKRKFSRGDIEIMKMAKFKKVEQGNRTMEEYVQEFRRVVRGSRYKGKPLVEEFEKEMNGKIRRKLIEVEYSTKSIEQWYERMINFNKHQRKSRKKEERLRRRKEIETQMLRVNISANAVDA